MENDNQMGSLFVNPMILLLERDFVKLNIAARYLKTVTDLTDYTWPLEPMEMTMTRVNGKLTSESDLSCAHKKFRRVRKHKLTSFIIGGRQYTYTRGIYGPCGLPNFFSRLLTIHFARLIGRKQPTTYIDDAIMQSQNKNKIFTVIIEHRTLLWKASLKTAPEKYLFFL